MTITARLPAPSSGQTQRGYTATAQAVPAQSGCVQEQDADFPDATPGARVRVALDPARGKGGPEGWCPGRFRGIVTAYETFLCPSEGSCRPPPGIRERSSVVGRFSFRVR